MSERKTLTLKKPEMAEKIALSVLIGERYIDRKGRYIHQKYVHYKDKDEHTWVDVPLVPETYGMPA